MPALTTLVLTDRAGTPVNHTFQPSGRPNGNTVLKVTNGTPIGDKQFVISTRKSATKRKISLRLALPTVVTETINGIDSPKVVRTAYANIDFNFDVASTSQERDDCIGMLMSALDSSKTLVDKTVVDLEDIW